MSNPPKKTASTRPSKSSDADTATSPATGQSTSPGGFTDSDAFRSALLLKLAGEIDCPFRIAKVVVKRPEKGEPEMQPYGFLRDDWVGDMHDTLKAIDFIAFSEDKVEMYRYKTHSAIGLTTLLPIPWIKGFVWATEEEVQKFLDIHAYKEPN